MLTHLNIKQIATMHPLATESSCAHASLREPESLQFHFTTWPRCHDRLLSHPSFQVVLKMMIENLSIMFVWNLRPRISQSHATLDEASTEGRGPDRVLHRKTFLLSFKAPTKALKLLLFLYSIGIFLSVFLSFYLSKPRLNKLLGLEAPFSILCVQGRSGT